MKYDLTESREILRRTPEVLNQLLLGLPEAWIKTNEGDETWSPYDIVGHLIHGEKTDWITRTIIILSPQSKTFTPFDRFAQFEESKGKSMADLLKEFAELRRTNLQKLDTFQLTEEEMDKTGIHPEFGEVSLRQLLACWTAHDLGHIYQITRVMARNYTEEVGPWRKYLRVLND